MAASRILVTGASGFVGRHLVAELARSFPDALLLTGRIEFNDRDLVRQAIIDTRPDICIHLAAMTDRRMAHEDQPAAWNVNLMGTLALARAVLEEAPLVPLLYVGACHAYGDKGETPVDEQAALAPSDTFAATKAAADMALGSLVKNGLRVIRLRPFDHVGPGQSPHATISGLARAIARIEAGLEDPVLSVPSPDTARDYLDVRDVCRAYASCIALAQDLQPGTIFNIASGIARPMRDVVHGLVAHSSSAISVAEQPSGAKNLDPAYSVGDASLARGVLGWQPSIDWQTTLADVLGYWRRQDLR